MIDLLTHTHAVNIQRLWRGYFARSQRQLRVTDAEDAEVKSVEMTRQRNLLLSPARRKVSFFSASNASLESSMSAKAREKTPFDKSRDLVVFIDGALHLPPTTTITRLHAALYTPSMKQVPDSAVTALCELQSMFHSPQFTVKIRWKGAVLHPTMTIVVHVETLETPTLEPRTIGIAAVRVCVNNIGMQPLSEVVDSDQNSPSIFFNTGQFMSPLLYGSLSSAEMDFLTESKAHEHCTHIEGAFLRVGLLALRPTQRIPEAPFSAMTIDANKRPAGLKLDAQTDADREREMMVLTSSSSSHHLSSLSLSLSPNAAVPLHGASLSAASVFLRQYLLHVNPIVDDNNNDSSNNNLNGRNCKDRWPIALHLPRSVIRQFLSLASISGVEAETALSTLRDFLTRLFREYAPAAREHKPSICSRFLLEYSESQGALVSLNLLHNMPLRKKLLAAAKGAGAVKAMQSGLSRGWDNKINVYKTVFRYLPGELFDEDTRALTRAQTARTFAEKEAELERDKSVRSMSLYDVARAQGPHDHMHLSPTQNFDAMYADLSERDRESPSLVVDDASLRLSLASSERCPEYDDDFSCTQGLSLGRRACLLVLVSAVDVLTTSRGPANHKNNNTNNTNNNNNNYKNANTNANNNDHARAPSTNAFLSISPRRDSKSSLYAESLHSARSHATHLTLNPFGRGHGADDREKEQKRKRKLGGLRGVYVAREEPRHTFWGILPLFTQIPSPSPADTQGPIPPDGMCALCRAQCAQCREADLFSGAGGEETLCHIPHTPSNAPTPTAQARSQSHQVISDRLPQSLSRDFVEKNYSQFLSADSQQVSPTVKGLHTPHNAHTPTTHSHTHSHSPAHALTQRSALPPIPAHTHLRVHDHTHTHSHCVHNVSPTHHAWFVRDGLHQIPLFQGSPPPALLVAADPMGWLVSRLGHQLSRQELKRAQLSRCVNRMLCATMGSLRWLASRATMCVSAPSVRERERRKYSAKVHATHEGDEHTKTQEENVRTTREEPKTSPSLSQKPAKAQGDTHSQRAQALLGLSERGSEWFRPHGATFSLHADSTDDDANSQSTHSQRTSAAAQSAPNAKSKDDNSDGSGANNNDVGGDANNNNNDLSANTSSKKNKKSSKKKSSKSINGNNNNDKKKKKSEELVLSAGCSAFIRIVDPRLRRLASPVISFTPQTQSTHVYASSVVSGNSPLYNKRTDSVSGSHRHINNGNNDSVGTAHGSFSNNTSTHSHTAVVHDGAMNDLLFMMSHAAVSEEDDNNINNNNDDNRYNNNNSNEGIAAPRVALQFEERQFKDLSQQFRLPPASVLAALSKDSKRLAQLRGRRFEEAIPATVDKEALLEEINSKFHESLSSWDMN